MKRDPGQKPDFSPSQAQHLDNETEEIVSRAGLLPDSQPRGAVDAAVGRVESLVPERAAALTELAFEIVDLAGDMLGQAPGRTIQVDAARRGWWVDETLWDDRDFGAADAFGDLVTRENGPASGRVGLLTAVPHELGHTLGHNHESTGLMDYFLPLGRRRLPLIGFDGVLQSDSFEAGVIDQAFASLRSS